MHLEIELGLFLTPLLSKPSFQIVHVCFAMAPVGVTWAFTPSRLLYEVCSAFVHLAVNEIRFEVGLFLMYLKMSPCLLPDSRSLFS